MRSEVGGRTSEVGRRRSDVGGRRSEVGTGSTMNIEEWLKAAIADAERRGLPELKPLLEALAQATRALRAERFGGQANGPTDH